MDGLEEHQGFNLPQEQEYGAASAWMFMARNSAPQFEVSFDWLIQFQISLLQNVSINSLF